MSYCLPRATQVVAHRGNAGPFPENSRAALESAMALGVAMVEVDVRLSRDRVPVLVHNATLEATSDGHGPVAAYTAAELQQLDAGSWKDPRFAGQRILTLDEALALTRGRVALNLDIKTAAAIAPALAAVRRHGRTDSVVFTGCLMPDVARLRRDAPEITVLLNISDGLARVAQRRDKAIFDRMVLWQAAECGAAGLNLSHRLVDQALVDGAHAQGLSVWVWTVDDPDRAVELAALGAASITTNWPARLLPLLA